MTKTTFFSFIALCLFLTPAFSQLNPRNIEVDWETDKTNKIVPLEEFTTLLMPDGIPPIDEPKFWNKEQALQAYFEHEPVIALSLNGEAKAYPLSVLMFHEIVNDSLDNVPIAITYCPLCNAAIVFDRRFSHQGNDYVLDFGVSGMLRKSDLVMWDRQTQSWWQQLTGEALVGLFAGSTLDFIPSMLISLEDYSTTYPDGKILSTETGHFRQYGTNPYTQYDSPENTQPRFFKEDIDERLPAMERIINVHIGGDYKVYPLSIVQQKKVINDRFNDKLLVLFFEEKTVSVLDEAQIAESKQIGSVTVFRATIDNQPLTFTRTDNGFRDDQTNSIWSITGKCIDGKFKGRELWPINHGNHFAFAWFAFHPESEIYGQP